MLLDWYSSIIAYTSTQKSYSHLTLNECTIHIPLVHSSDVQLLTCTVRMYSLCPCVNHTQAIQAPTTQQLSKYKACGSVALGKNPVFLCLCGGFIDFLLKGGWRSILMSQFERTDDLIDSIQSSGRHMKYRPDMMELTDASSHSKRILNNSISKNRYGRSTAVSKKMGFIFFIWRFLKFPALISEWLTDHFNRDGPCPLAYSLKRHGTKGKWFGREEEIWKLRGKLLVTRSLDQLGGKAQGEEATEAAGLSAVSVEWPFLPSAASSTTA